MSGAEDFDLALTRTEAVREDLREIDLAPTAELVALMNAEDRTVPEAVGRVGPALAVAIDGIVERLSGGGRLVYVGAGTSGRMGMLDSVECGPTFNTVQVAAILAGGELAFARAAEDAEDDEPAGADVIGARGVTAADAVVGIAASGRTPYVIGAMRAARAAGALTVGLSCNPDSALSREVDHPIEVVTGPEILAGSTRLKAGTAQKLVVNTISTVSMMRLGKTYGNLMVDVRATNEKLRRRAAAIVEQATGADLTTAQRALDAAGGDAKVAIFTVLTGTGAEEARRSLAAHGGRLREALAEAP